MSEVASFKIRKSQHIDLAMNDSNQAVGLSGFDKIKLPHQALPEINFSEITFENTILGKKLKTPFFISAMTAGNDRSLEINKIIVKACQKRGWMFGFGSQRRQLLDNSNALYDECEVIRNLAPDINILSNIGLSQLIHLDLNKVRSLLDSIHTDILVIHTNPLQEALQPEGTPNFRGGLNAIEKIVKNLDVNIVLKETGCGISKKAAAQLDDVGVDAVDVSGLGGTHWGRIEGKRSSDNSVLAKASETFQDWGIPTTESIKNSVGQGYEVWASGGVRSGLDALKSFYLGANAVGFAKPALTLATSSGYEALEKWMETIETEFKVGMFCMGKSQASTIGGTSEEN